jgi:hypothetical protein
VVVNASFCRFQEAPSVAGLPVFLL